MAGFCLVCGGPSLNPAKIMAGWPHTPEESVSVLSDLSHLSEHASKYGWLDKFLGIPEDNEPVELGVYDYMGNCTLPNNKLFCPYPSYAQAARTDDKEYGLTCHTKCYQLLRDRLSYKLRYQDVWPKLAAVNDDSECLRSTYGGITDYHEHLFNFKFMDEDRNAWMLLDPIKNEQNAQRILTVWNSSFVPEAQRPALALAVGCTFKRAAKLAETTSQADEHHVLWQAMATLLLSVLCTIIEKATVTA